MSEILIIDDEPQIRRFLTICLESQGYKPVTAETGTQGLQKIAELTPAMVILDLGLPDLDGQEVLIRLREFYHGPVIVLSVRDTEREKVTALDNGANDYIEKPFGANELLARVRSVLRTFDGFDASPGNYDDGHLKLDLAAHRVILNGTDVHLSRKEFDLLYFLMVRAGRIVTQQQILTTLWGPSHTADTHYLRIFIGRLRAKLGDTPTQPRYIETEAGVGYRFIGNG